MCAHEYYRELGALAAIGQISHEEDHELSSHIEECEECRSAYSDYLRILRRGLPSVDPARYRLKRELVHPDSQQEIRERFFARARSEGTQVDPEIEANVVKRQISVGETRLTRLLWSTSAVAVIVVLSFTAVWWDVTHIQNSRSHTANLVQENQSLRSALLQSQKISSDTDSHPESIVIASEQALTEKVTSLERDLGKSSDQIKVLESQLASAQSEDQTLASGRQQDQARIQQLQIELSNERAKSTSLVADLVDTRAQIATLRNTSDEATERLAMEEQLTTAASDVRKLMGARNLHIIDVHDVTDSGQSKKAFGRVFYAENQSLVFYAFDLPAHGSNVKYYFRAWGQKEGDEHSVRNIGTFSIDDHEQRRWVLKVSDPALLKNVDSLFVTAEAKQDSVKPNGTRILYAYLAARANHP